MIPRRSPLPGRAGVGVASVLLLLTGVLSACGGPSTPRSISPEGRFAWAREQFRQGNWNAAEQALREFLLNNPLHAKSDSGQYLLGESLYQRGKYLESAEAFERLATNRPTSPLADDAQFGVCRARWELSPDLALDQTPTRDAAEACTRLLQFFSPSELEDEARALRQEARDKLARKWYRTGRWYFDIGAYESANIYFEQILDHYPNANVMAELLLALYRSYRNLGFDAEAESVRRRLLEQHAGSAEAEELGGSDSGSGEPADNGG